MPHKFSISLIQLVFYFKNITSINFYFFKFNYNYIIIIHMLSQDLIQSYLDSQLSQEEVQKCHQKFLESIKVIKQKNDHLEENVKRQAFVNQFALSSVFRRQKSLINYLLTQLQLFEKILPKIYKQIAQSSSPSNYHKILVNSISKEIRRFKQLMPISIILNIYSSKISQSKIMHSTIIEEEEHQKEIYKQAEEMRRPRIKIQSNIDDKSQIIVSEQETENVQRNSADERSLKEQIQLLGKLYQFGKFTQSQCQDSQNEQKKKQKKQEKKEQQKMNSIRQTRESISARTSIDPVREINSSVIKEEPAFSWKQIGLRQKFRQISQNKGDSWPQKIIKAGLFTICVILAIVFLCFYFAFKLFNSLTGSL